MVNTKCVCVCVWVAVGLCNHSKDNIFVQALQAQTSVNKQAALTSFSISRSTASAVTKTCVGEG